MRVFVYGTLLEASVFARFAGRAPGFRAAVLAGWRRVGLRGTRYPTLVRGLGVVVGAVVEVDAAGLRRLEAYEGPRYRRMWVAVRAGGRKTVAMAWKGDAPTRRPWP